MEKKEIKATIILDGKAHEIMISKARAEQIKRLKKLIRGSRNKKENN